MKKMNLEHKLVLRKIAVSKLNTNQLAKINGGKITRTQTQDIVCLDETKLCPDKQDVL